MLKKMGAISKSLFAVNFMKTMIVLSYLKDFHALANYYCFYVIVLVR